MPTGCPRLIPLIFLLLIPPLLAGCSVEVPAPGEGVLRVMTWNIHYGADVRALFNLDAIAGIIAGSRAQIAVLQEVDRVWGARSYFRDEAERLAAKTGKYMAFGAALDRRPAAPGRGEYGLCILSDYPIAMSEIHLLPGDLEQRGVLLAWIETPHGLLPVAGTHLGLSAADRADQIAEALAWLPDRPDLLLLGDLNAEANAPELGPLFGVFQDIQAACGGAAAGTFRYRGAWRRIDYILAGPSWQPQACLAPPVRTSDHRPVVADLKPAE